MKLIFCPFCQDIFNLKIEMKTCSCGKSFGKYVDDVNAEISKDSIPLGFINTTFVKAIKEIHPNTFEGYRFIAFIIPRNASTIKIKSENE